MNFVERMTPDQLVAELLNHFRVFHKPDSPEEAMWSRSMAAVLGGYNERVLAHACAKILKTRRNERFPLPADIAAVCDEVQADIDRPRLLAAEMESKRAMPWSRDRIAFVVEQLMTGALGRRAVTENWHGALYDFCRENNRIPDETEIRRLKHSSVETSEFIDDSLRGKYGPVPKRVAGSLIKRRALLEAVLAGREPVASLWSDIRGFDEERAA